MVAGKRFTGGVMIAFVCAFAMLAVAALASAETPAIDKGKDMIGPTVIEKDAGSRTGSGVPAEKVIGELGKGTERPMAAPELSEGGLDMRHLIVPDRVDFENALESDRMSELSF